MRIAGTRAVLFGAALTALIPSASLAGVIGRSCQASLTAFGGGAGPSTSTTTSSCSASIYDAATVGAVGGSGTSIVGGGATVHYESLLDAGEDAFTLRLQSGGSGSLDLRSEAYRGTSTSVSYGGWVSSYDSFSVDRPYNFELEYDVGGLSSLGLSGDLLHGGQGGGGQGYFGNIEAAPLYLDKLAAAGKDVAGAKMRLPELFTVVAENKAAAMDELAPHFHHVNNSYGEWAAEDQALGDTTTLADPSVAEGIKARYLAAATDED